MSFHKLSENLFTLQNKIRSNPKSFIPYLTNQLEYFEDDIYYCKPDSNEKLETYEGKSAVIEAIAFLNKCKPAPPLELNSILSTSSQSHADDIGSNGLYEHVGSDGRSPLQRIKQKIQWSGYIGENLDFNNNTAEDVMFSFIVDDGLPERSRRNNVLSSECKNIGIGISEHSEFDICLVVDYLGEIINENRTENINSEKPKKTENLSENLPKHPDFIERISNIEEYDEIYDEDAPSNAIAVQVITEQVRNENQSFLRQVKVYHDNEGAIEVISKILNYN